MKPTIRALSNLIPKKELRRYLFEFKVPLSYKDVTQTLESAGKPDEISPPSSVSADDIMTLKRILETRRKRTGKIDRSVAEVENNLVEQAAEMGHNSAIALLAGRVLSTRESQTEEDTTNADSLLTQLMDRGHALAFKISGDLAYTSGYSQKAIKFYQLAVDHDIEDNAVKVECLRNIGLIHFMNKSVTQARSAFEEAIDVAEDAKQVMDCHYYLGQILEQNKQAVKYHFERAASHGLKEAFAPLGFLHLNYFNRPYLAVEWFKLGKEIGDVNCLIGLLDVYVKHENKLEKAEPILGLLKSTEQGQKAMEFRTDSVNKIEQYVQDKEIQSTPASSDRWGF